MAAPTTEAIERLTERKVLGYHSQITFDPDCAFESSSSMKRPHEPRGHRDSDRGGDHADRGRVLLRRGRARDRQAGFGQFMSDASLDLG